MDASLLLGPAWRVMHRHDDEWIQMERRTPAHDPATIDPERHWGDATIYACPRCDEQVTVAHEPDRPPGG